MKRKYILCLVANDSPKYLTSGFILDDNIKTNVVETIVECNSSSELHTINNFLGIGDIRLKLDNNCLTVQSLDDKITVHRDDFKYLSIVEVAIEKDVLK